MVPVTAGIMRNLWWPKGVAEYLTLQKIADLGVKKDASFERDSTFRSKAERRFERQLEKEESNEEALEMESLSQMVSEQPDEPAPIVELDLLSVSTPGHVAGINLLTCDSRHKQQLSLIVYCQQISISTAPLSPQHREFLRPYLPPHLSPRLRL